MKPLTIRKDGRTAKVQIACPANNYVRGPRSLKVHRDDSLVNLLLKDLQVLRIKNYRNRKDAPSDIHPLAFEAWFGRTKHNNSISLTFQDLPSKNEIDQIPEDFELIKTKLVFYMLENNKLRKENLSFNTEISKYKDKYEALSNTVEGREIKALENSPLIADLIDGYEKSCHDLKDGGKNNISVINKLNDFLKNMGILKYHEIKSKHIRAFLESYSRDGKNTAVKFNRGSKKVSPFFTWATLETESKNPIKFVEKKVEDNQDDIHFHSVDEIEEVKSNTDLYWSTVIAINAYAGLSSHAIRGLLKSDIIFDGNDYYIHVRKNKFRSLKRKRRIRKIKVNKLLKPTLEKYLNSNLSGKELLFPADDSCKCVFWRKDTFSKRLLSHLPDGMNSLSLRRTFGSLLIRSGKSVEEIAALMGNTVEVVQDYYAKLLAKEVDSEIHINQGTKVGE